MKPARKWAYGETREDDHYEDVLIPDDASCYADNMNAQVACAQCGRHLRFGDTYTSKEIHTCSDAAFGYAVCQSCHRAEWERQLAANSRVSA